MTKYTTFAIFVIIFVVLTGAGFGTFAGLVYSDTYWWIATTVGSTCGLFLAKLYLTTLTKLSTKGYNKNIIWLLGTLTAIICGMICTVIIHVLMGIFSITLLPVTNQELDVTSDLGIFALCVAIAQIYAIVAGLVVGGICSLIYVLLIQGKSNAAL